MELFASVWRRSSRFSFGRDLDPTNPPGRLGITSLHEGAGAKVDIVFVHGLYGDSLRSWTAPNGVLWPRDILPLDVPNCRILTYGYDGKPFDASHLAHATLYHGADALLNALHRVRNSPELPELERRPLIFVCHSLGGLLVQSLLVKAGNSKRVRNDAYNIYKATCGVIFLGTPYPRKDNGSWAKAIQGIVSLNRDDSFALKPLVEEFNWLAVQLDQYKSISGSISNAYFYELRKESTTRPPSTLIVSEAVAAPLSLLKESSQVIGLDADHSNMIKFGGRDDLNYALIIHTIQAMVEEVDDQISEYFTLSQSKMTLRPDQIAHLIGTLKISYPPIRSGNTRIFGQAHALANVHTLLRRAEASPNSRQTVTISGPPGAGKSALVLKYVQAHRANYSHVIWLDARSVRSLKKSFSGAMQMLVADLRDLAKNSPLSEEDLVHHLGLEGELNEDYRFPEYPWSSEDRGFKSERRPFRDTDNFLVDSLKEFLDRPIMKRWLLIFDNFHGTFKLSSFVPETPNGRTILIKTSSHVEKGPYTINIDEMEEDSALELLASASNMDPDIWTLNDLECAKYILQRSGRTPSAIITAGSVMRDSSLSLQDFADRISRQSRGAEAMVEVLGLYITGQGTDITKELLERCAFLSDSPIPVEMLRIQLGSVDRHSLANALDLLLKNDLNVMIPKNKEKFLKLEPTTTSLIREQLSDEERFRAIEQALFMIIKSIDGFEDHEPGMIQEFEHTVYPHVVRCLQHAKELEKIDHKYKIASLEYKEWSTLAATCEREGDYRNSARMFSKAFRLVMNRIETANTEPRYILDLLEAGSRASSALFQQESDDDAEEVCTEAVETILSYWDFQDLGPRSLELIVEMLVCLDRIAEARELYKIVLAGIEKADGPNSLGALRVVELLALSYSNVRMYDESVSLFERGILSLERQLGPFNPRVVRTWRALAKVHSKQNNFNEAEEKLRLAIDANESRLGKDHPQTLVIKAELAIVLSRSGKLERSHMMFDEVLQAEKRIVGERHPIYLDTLGRRAESYRMQGRIEEAKAARLEILSLKGKILAENDPDFKESIWEVAELHDVGERRRVVRSIRSDFQLDSQEDLKDPDSATTDSRSFIGTSREPSEYSMAMVED